MEFLRVVGDRRTIRWFRPWQPVEPAQVQRILEAARLSACPGNLQPWRAVVVVARDLDEDDRARLLDAANHQRQQEQAPVWIYWFADTAAVAPSNFTRQVLLALEVGALSEDAGWSAGAVRAAIDEGVPVPPGMAPLHRIAHGVPPQVAAAVAMQETNAAIVLAQLAAVNEGLGTGLQVAATPEAVGVLHEVLGVPETFLPVWLQLVGHAAESPDAGGQRPRDPFEEAFALGRWGTPFPRDPAVVEDLRRVGLIQPPAPVPGRAEEVRALARMFGYRQADADRSAAPGEEA